MKDFEVSPEDLRRFHDQSLVRSECDSIPPKTSISEVETRTGEELQPLSKLETEAALQLEESGKRESLPLGDTPMVSKRSDVWLVLLMTLGFWILPVGVILIVHAITRINITSVVSGLMSLLVIGCFLLVLAKLYRAGERRTAVAFALLSFILVGPLLTYLIGIRRANRYRLETILCIWTLCFVFTTLFSVLDLWLRVKQIQRETEFRQKLSDEMRKMGSSQVPNLQDQGWNGLLHSPYYKLEETSEPWARPSQQSWEIEAK